MELQTSKKDKPYFKVADRVWGLTDMFTNMYLIQNERDSSWVLIDSGLKSSYSKIKNAVKSLFGEDSRPAAILLTHGHFDHTGSVQKLAEEWQVPVYAHALELPYLTAKSSYPPADPSVGGGLMSYFSEFYPSAGPDLTNSVSAFPDISEELPFLPGWKVLHTPGHSPGHVSFWREQDKVLIVGDAFVTTTAESAFSVLTQNKLVSGPPKYFTCDWLKAENSVELLASMLPDVVASGHGKPMSGLDMQQELLELAYYFRQLAVPASGRYVDAPAMTDLEGVVSLPKERKGPKEVFLTVSVITAVSALGWALFSKYKQERSLALAAE